MLQVLYEESKGEAIITTGVGQHQMFAGETPEGGGCQLKR
jgi:thiamine pyrophosphate-dependent acetolactate synthase large subunit-like protein